MQVEWKLILMFTGVRHLPALERDGDVVEKTIVRSSKGPERTTHNADIVKEEEWVVLVGSISRLGSSSATPIIDCMKAVEHLQCLRSIETWRFGFRNEVLGYVMSDAIAR